MEQCNNVVVKVCIIDLSSTCVRRNVIFNDVLDVWLIYKQFLLVCIKTVEIHCW